MFAAGQDYIARPISFTLTERNFDFIISVPIIDDYVYELDEKFYVNITTTDSNVIIVRHSVAINIQDDEGNYFKEKKKKDEALFV